MKNKLEFIQVTESKFKTLRQYVPIVARVHGEHHPEFYDVKKVFEEMVEKLANSDQLNLDTEILKLREITNNYEVPGDVCGSYEAVYVMLKEIDDTYFG